MRRQVARSKLNFPVEHNRTVDNGPALAARINCKILRSWIETVGGLSA